MQVLGQRTEGFSGSDINTVVKDVLMQPIRLLRDATHFRKVRHGRQQQAAVNCAAPHQTAVLRSSVGAPWRWALLVQHCCARAATCSLLQVSLHHHTAVFSSLAAGTGS
eukprot:GHRQ01034860.1.p1 GENE.GHRQ01034860.1~~GHRQ01034860.1.p1  ORF type:complete len:109 (-),score=25.75 GHRQ01034860.1:55-381(-)